MFSSVRVVASVIRSDHKAVVEFAEHQRLAGKTKTVKLNRKVKPTQHAVFLQHICTVRLDDAECPDSDTQTQFDTLTDTALHLLNKSYPERAIAVTSRNPNCITAGTPKNRLMRSG